MMNRLLKSLSYCWSVIHETSNSNQWYYFCDAKPGEYHVVADTLTRIFIRNDGISCSSTE